MNAKDARFAAMADKAEGRDHDVQVAYRDRIVQSEGAFGRAWLKFNPGVKLVSVFDDKGREWRLTPKQAGVYDLARTLLEKHVTMRDMSRQLEYAPSTVSRALWKLEAIGLIAFIATRAGTIIISRVAGDGLERFQKAAKAKLRQWSLAAERRVSRLKEGVALYFHEGERRRTDSLGQYTEFLVSKSATPTRPWGWEEIEEALR